MTAGRIVTPPACLNCRGHAPCQVNGVSVLRLCHKIRDASYARIPVPVSPPIWEMTRGRKGAPILGPEIAHGGLHGAK